MCCMIPGDSGFDWHWSHFTHVHSRYSVEYMCECECDVAWGCYNCCTIEQVIKYIQCQDSDSEEPLHFVAVICA